MPSRITTMPPTVSPSPCHSATPSRMSGPNVTVPKISDEHRRAVLGCNGNCFQVAQRTQIAESANHVFGPAHFKQASTNFVRTCANSFNDRRERDAIGAKFVGVEVDLVLAHESANGGYLGHSRNSFELVAQIPILKTAQVGQTALMAVVHKRVFIDPSCAGRIRPDDRMHARRQTSRDLLHVLQDTRPRPVQDLSCLQTRRRRRSLQTWFVPARLLRAVPREGS